jgi:hypothetical protein
VRLPSTSFEHKIMTSQDRQLTYQELVEYKKKARYVFMKLHKEIDDLKQEVKVLEQINGILRAKLKGFEK